MGNRTPQVNPGPLDVENVDRTPFQSGAPHPRPTAGLDGMLINVRPKFR
jgi:hypothetical protein